MNKQKSAPIVQSASDFAAVVFKLMPFTKVLLIEDKDISRNDETWSEADAVPGIKNVHVMKAVPNQDLLFSSAQTSFPKSIPASSVPPAADAEQTFKENDCVLVKYDISRNCYSSCRE